MKDAINIILIGGLVLAMMILPPIVITAYAGLTGWQTVSVYIGTATLMGTFFHHLKGFADQEKARTNGNT